MFFHIRNVKCVAALCSYNRYAWMFRIVMWINWNNLSKCKFHYVDWYLLYRVSVDRQSMYFHCSEVKADNVWCIRVSSSIHLYFGQNWPNLQRGLSAIRDANAKTLRRRMLNACDSLNCSSVLQNPQQVEIVEFDLFTNLCLINITERRMHKKIDLAMC